MRYMLEVRGYGRGHGTLQAKTVEAPTYIQALEAAHAFASECLEGWDEVIDIWVVKDEDWTANRWNEGQHFTLDNMQMRFRMYRNEVQE